MLDVIRSIFDSAQFVPHGMCLLWRPDLLVLHGGSDVLIALAYFTIPLLILKAQKRRPDLIDPGVVRMFAAFITACALSHTGAFLTLWYPAYALQGIVKLLTAGVSIYTALQLARLLPSFLVLPSREDMIRKDAQIMIGKKIVQESQEAQSRLSEFAHIASHDLKAPLRGISNQAQFIDQDHNDTLAPDARKRLGRIVELCEHVESLISTLMTYSSIGASSSVMSVNVRDSVGDIVGSLSEFLSLRNATVDIETDLPDLDSDPAQIDTVFRNLIMNGVVYNDEARKTIKIGYLPRAHINGRQIDEAYYVKDNGIGINEEFHDSVFKMFKRLHNEQSYGPGSGSGLTFVKKVVEISGGVVDFTSSPGAGSTFYISFAKQPEPVEGERTEGSRLPIDASLPGAVV
ncbi:ATP-binding protein [uncultured Roseobacter sp.]|uniref:sensor histidine kinase n=1 Tax=uncultured Roseobacter sp. TaxID=114847 RepID=UPI002633931F|nr:ATP-binding protein [uncultured Roseobacter sp.]